MQCFNYFLIFTEIEGLLLQFKVKNCQIDDRIDNFVPNTIVDEEKQIALLLGILHTNTFINYETGSNSSIKLLDN